MQSDRVEVIHNFRKAHREIISDKGAKTLERKQHSHRGTV